MEFNKFSTTFISQNSHTTLNKNLSEELIYKITTYLSIQDILHLCISKLFLPCFVNSPWFFDKMSAYFTHLLASAYSESNSLFMICAVSPAIVQNTFYFSIDHSKLPYFKSVLGSGHVFSLYHLDHVLKIWPILFQPYSTFKKRKRYYLKSIRKFPLCYNNCPCLKYRQAPFFLKREQTCANQSLPSAFKQKCKQLFLNSHSIPHFKFTTTPESYFELYISY